MGFKAASLALSFVDKTGGNGNEADGMVQGGRIRCERLEVIKSVFQKRHRLTESTVGGLKQQEQDQDLFTLLRKVPIRYHTQVFVPPIRRVSDVI